MSISSRLDRLEKENRDAEIRCPTWNLKNVSTADLIELRNLIGINSSKVAEIQSRLIETRILTYEHSK